MVLTYILLFIFLLYFFLHWIQKPWRHWPIFLLPRKSETFYLFFKINTATSSLSPFFLFCFQLVYKVMGCTEIFPWMCHSIFDLRSPVQPSLIPPPLSSYWLPPSHQIVFLSPSMSHLLHYHFLFTPPHP